MGSPKKIRLTAAKLEALKLELEGLKTKGRQEITDRLHEIQSQTIEELDSPYVEASDDRNLLEARIEEIEEIIKKVEITDDNHSVEFVDIGSTVTVEVNGSKKDFMLVDEIEADPMMSKIAVESPVGAALFQKKVGDTVEIDVNGNVTVYKVKSIK